MYLLEFPPSTPVEVLNLHADDGSEWQEAKPKRSHLRRDQQQQQQQEDFKQAPSTSEISQEGMNGHSDRASGHDRPPASASASQKGDPILASLNRSKPALHSRGCAQCSDPGHK